MKLAFFGSPQFVVPLLSHIHAVEPVSLIISQPDKPIGRKQEMTPTAVSLFAKKHNISLECPKTLKDFKLPEIDLAIVAAYGLLIPQSVLRQPKIGFINIHYSLLPAYRGASPVQFALLHNEKETGVTLMKMDEKLDHGPIISTSKVEVTENDTTKSLLEKLNVASIPLLSTVLHYTMLHGELPESFEQNHEKATFSTKLTKEDGYIPFEIIKNTIQGNPTSQKELIPLIGKLHNTETGQLPIVLTIHNMIRAFYPWPITWTKLPNGKRMQFISSKIDGKKLVITAIKIEGKNVETNLKQIAGIFS